MEENGLNHTGSAGRKESGSIFGWWFGLIARTEASMIISSSVSDFFVDVLHLHRTLSKTHIVLEADCMVSHSENYP